MSSTYSNLKIELIGTGDQTGSWGLTTNTNLGTALEEAIVGSADVTFASGDVTITLTDTNSTQTARNLRLNLTGTSGGTRNLILGSGCQIEKPYLINNGCADSITVKNTTGTGITVPAGKSMWVYNNGTDVVDVVTHLTSLTIGSDGYSVGYLKVPPVGTKTGSYILAVGDVGKYVQVGSGGSITIPDATFSEGDAISIFNNTSGNITITCSITTAYVAGTDTDRSTMTLTTRGVATILFISSTVCVVSGSVV
jgi:hypothetical protein